MPKNIQEQIKNIVSILTHHAPHCNNQEELAAIKQEIESLDQNSKAIVASAQEAEIFRGMVSTLRKENKKLRETLESSGKATHTAETSQPQIWEENQALKKEIESLRLEKDTLLKQLDTLQQQNTSLAQEYNQLLEENESLTQKTREDTKQSILKEKEIAVEKEEPLQKERDEELLSSKKTTTNSLSATVSIGLNDLPQDQKKQEEKISLPKSQDSGAKPTKPDLSKYKDLSFDTMVLPLKDTKESAPERKEKSTKEPQERKEKVVKEPQEHGKLDEDEVMKLLQLEKADLEKILIDGKLRVATKKAGKRMFKEEDVQEFKREMMDSDTQAFVRDKDKVKKTFYRLKKIYRESQD